MAQDGSAPSARASGPFATADADPSRVRGLVEEFAETVSRHPNRTAITQNDQEYTYAELQACVRAVAVRLGRRPGVVAVPARHSADTVVCLLAVWEAGGTYLPVDPAFPLDRRETMLSVAGCDAELEVESDPAQIAEDLLDLTEFPEAQPDPPDPESPAYVLFTSGSTGEPKAVVTPHRAIAAVVGCLRDEFGLTQADRVLQFASLNWDTCFEEILPALTTGATLVFDDEAHTGSFPRFLRMVETQQISVLDLPTAFWHELVRYLAEDQLPLPHCLRMVVIGGEAVSPARLAEWCRLDTGHIRLVNSYGCTETTLITHAVDLHGPVAPRIEMSWDNTTAVPIGRALPHVVEQIGPDSELLIGGRGIALGYRGLPEETKARFDPFGAGGDRLFHTGDRVARRTDGMLDLLGRLDHEVKVRGVRVDPAEVEAHVASCPEVATAAVVGTTLAGRTALVAYVVPEGEADEGDLGATVRSHLSERVPGHLVPTRITVVPSFAFTASGKLDRLRTHERHRVVGPGRGEGG